MSIERVKECLAHWGKEEDLIVPEVSTATVEDAASALSVSPKRIAKSISIYKKDIDSCLIIVAAGDAKIDNLKFKATFGWRPRMLASEDVERLTGYPIGGVCPLNNTELAEVYLDVSLKRFETVFTAGGTAQSMVRFDGLEELLQVSEAKEWVDVCKAWQEVI